MVVILANRISVCNLTIDDHDNGYNAAIFEKPDLFFKDSLRDYYNGRASTH